MKRKQPSGYQNRKRRAERNAELKKSGQLMPSVLTIADVSSLTAITGTRLQALSQWLKKEGLPAIEWVKVAHFSIKA